MSPEIFPMFTEAIGDIYLYRFNSTQQLSRCIVLLCIVLALTFCCFIRRQQKQIAGYRSQFFVKHSEEYQVNIRAKVNIQTCIKRSPVGNSLLTALTNLKVIQCRWWKSEVSPTTNWPQTVHHYLFTSFYHFLCQKKRSKRPLNAGGAYVRRGLSTEGNVRFRAL